MKKLPTTPLKRMVFIALLASIAMLCMLCFGISVIPGATYLKYEPSGGVILLCGLLLGPAGAFGMRARQMHFVFPGTWRKSIRTSQRPAGHLCVCGVCHVFAGEDAARQADAYDLVLCGWGCCRHIGHHWATIT